MGHPQYAHTNAPLVALLDRGPAVAVHRGSGRGSIAENTNKAIVAALAEGADLVEIDIVGSSDGAFYLFHDGYEPMVFGIPERLTELSAAQIDALNYSWNVSVPGGYPVERLTDTLTAFPDTFFTVDRSWRWWDTLLDILAERGSVPHLVLKSPLLDEAVRTLAEHRAPFPYVPIVTRPADVEAVIADDRLNAVGFELIAAESDHPFCDPRYVAGLRKRGYCILLNALNLGNGVPLYAGFDDEVSLLDDPDKGWGELIRRGASIIQTDWPGPLHSYLEKVGLRPR